MPINHRKAAFPIIIKRRRHYKWQQRFISLHAALGQSSDYQVIAHRNEA